MTSAANGPGPAEVFSSCLEDRGVEAELLDEGFGVEAVGGQAGNGDVTFIVTTRNRRDAGTVLRLLKEKRRDADAHGVMLTSTLNGGSTVVGMIGVEGVEAGVPSTRSEELAKGCAVPRGPGRVRPLSTCG